MIHANLDDDSYFYTGLLILNKNLDGKKYIIDKLINLSNEGDLDY